MTFVKGQSGNPKGKPKGMNVSPIKQALRENSMSLFRKALDLANNGDKEMIKYILDRCKFDIRVDPMTIDAAKSSKEILDDGIQEFAAGDIDTTELNSLVGAVNTRITAIEAKDMDQRLSKLENNNAK